MLSKTIKRYHLECPNTLHCLQDPNVLGLKSLSAPVFSIKVQLPQTIQESQNRPHILPPTCALVCCPIHTTPSGRLLLIRQGPGEINLLPGSPTNDS